MDFVESVQCAYDKYLGQKRKSHRGGRGGGGGGKLRFTIQSSPKNIRRGVREFMFVAEVFYNNDLFLRAMNPALYNSSSLLFVYLVVMGPG